MVPVPFSLIDRKLKEIGEYKIMHDCVIGETETDIMDINMIVSIENNPYREIVTIYGISLDGRRISIPCTYELLHGRLALSYPLIGIHPDNEREILNFILEGKWKVAEGGYIPQIRIEEI